MANTPIEELVKKAMEGKDLPDEFGKALEITTGELQEMSQAIRTVREDLMAMHEDYLKEE